MEKENSKPLASLIFLPLLSLIFLRPFVSGLTYPVFEFWYEISIIALMIVLFSTRFANLKNIVRARPQAESRTNPFIPILLLLSAYTVSTITSINLHNSLKETLKFISYVSIFFIVSQASDNQKKSLIKAIVIAASIISVYSIYQYFWGYQHTIDYLKKTNSGFLLNSSYAKDVLIAKRAIGTFPSPNIFGGYLIMALFLSLYSYFSTRFACSKNIVRARPKRPSRELLSALLIIIALILTKSLGAWLSLIVCLIILFFISYNNLRNKKIIIAASAVCIAFILLFIILNRWERLMDMNNPQNSITQRINYWRTAIGVIKDHPFFGVGPGNFQEVFLKYKVGLSTNTRYAHNIFLHQWAETGLLGIIGILFFITSILKQYKPQNKYIFFACLAFLLHNLIDNSFLIPETGLLWWVICSLTRP